MRHHSLVLLLKMTNQTLAPNSYLTLRTHSKRSSINSVVNTLLAIGDNSSVEEEAEVDTAEVAEEDSGDVPEKNSMKVQRKDANLVLIKTGKTLPITG